MFEHLEGLAGLKKEKEGEVCAVVMCGLYHGGQEGQAWDHGRVRAFAPQDPGILSLAVA